MQPRLTTRKPALTGRNNLLLLLLCFFTQTLFAQKVKDEGPALPAFGAVGKTDLEMKECDFDKKAEAVVLLDEGVLEYVFGRGTDLKRRLRIKILSNKGLDWANVHLPFHSELGDESIGDLEAQTYNLDASGNTVVTKLDKKLIYEKKLNKKYSEKVFTFPEAKVGSVIEYRFKHSNIGLIDWYFQRSIPVKASHFTLDLPEEVETAVVPHCSRQYQTGNKRTSTRTVRYYAMSDIPGLRDEPFIINEDFYRDRLETKITAYNFPSQRTNRVVSTLR